MNSSGLNSVRNRGAASCWIGKAATLFCCAVLPIEKIKLRWKEDRIELVNHKFLNKDIFFGFWKPTLAFLLSNLKFLQRKKGKSQATTSQLPFMDTARFVHIVLASKSGEF